MEANWSTMYREGCIASEAAQIVSPAYIDAAYGSDEEDLLGRVQSYLWDRSEIALEFCDVVSSVVVAEPVDVIDECDIPF